MSHEHFAIEDRSRFTIENPFVELAAGAVGLAMIDQRMRVGMLSSVDHVETVDRTFGAFVIHRYINIMARKRSTKIDRGNFIARLRSEFGSGRADVKARAALTLHAIMLDSRAAFEVE